MIVIYKFLADQRAQGSTEYILIMGAIIIAAIIFIPIYREAVRTSGEMVNESVSMATNKVENAVTAELKKLK